MARSIKFKSEIEAFSYLRNNSVLIQNSASKPLYHDLKNELILVDNSLSWRKGYGTTSDDIIVFTSVKEKNDFLTLRSKGLLDGETAAEQLECFNNLVLELIGSKGGKLNLKDKNTIAAVNRKAAINILSRHELLDEKNISSDFQYAIMEFQKIHHLEITGKLNNETVKLLDDLTPESIRMSQKEALYGIIDDRASAEFQYTNYTKKGLLMNYFKPDPEYKHWIVYDMPTDLNLRNEIFQYLRENNYLPKKDANCTVLVKEKGIFRFQKDQGLTLTGYFDIQTIRRIEQIKVSEKRLPNFKNHLYEGDFKNEIFLNQAPFSYEHNIKIAEWDGRVYLSEDLENGNYLLAHTNLFKNEDEKKILKDYFNDFILKISSDLSLYPSTAFAYTLKIGSDEFILLLYLHDSKIRGYIHKANEFAKRAKNEMIFIKKNKYSFIWAGDDLISFDIMTEADKVGLPTLRRISQVRTVIDPQSILSSSSFNPANASLCNAIPRTKAELELGGFSTLEAHSWEKFYNQVNVLSEGKFSSIIKSKDELKEEIINGERDIVQIIAHSDGMYLYIGEERISITDISNWENRIVPLNKRRDAILIICNAGNTKIKKGIFRRRVASLCEQLINKGYVNRVIAPNHEIQKEEVIKILTELKNKKGPMEFRKLYKGWYDNVFILSKSLKIA